MDYQERFDEIDIFLSTLRYLRDDLKSKDLKDLINLILYENDLEEEQEELAKILNQEWEDEMREREREYRQAQGF